MREIGSPQIHTGYLTFSFKKPVVYWSKMRHRHVEAIKKYCFSIFTKTLCCFHTFWKYSW